MSDRIWLDSYPAGVPADIDASRHDSIVAMVEESFTRFADLPALSFLGRELSYRQLDDLSRTFAVYLQGLGLAKGERVAVMLPNMLQYPLAVWGILRAGYVLVNVNPLYTARELAYQLKDSGAKAIVILENFAATLQKCLAETSIRHVVLCAVGDQLGWFKGSLVNFVLRQLKRQVPPFHLPGAVRFNAALAQARHGVWQPVRLAPDDVAALQYTGGTTGLAKGAVLLQRNLVANLMQSEAWFQPALAKVPANEQLTEVCALPLYHVFAFTVDMLLCLRVGGKLVLIPNPRDARATLRELARHAVHVLPAVNTLFQALLRHADFRRVDWSHLVVSVGGGTAVQSSVASRWLAATQCPICEGYGLSETSPIVTCNPVTVREFSGSIGIPVPSTWVKVIDDQGNELGPGEPGEIVIKGPQLMAGYWQQPEETAQAMTADGYFRSGDIGTMDARGYFHILDRKKDMIAVSGFKVYPSEVEDVMAQLDGVLECACVGVPDAKTGEAVRLLIVRKSAVLTEQQVRAHCRENLTRYKQPREVVFRADLPKTPVGKILRRELRGL